MSSFFVIDCRYCVGAPKFLVVQADILTEWTFDLARAHRYENAHDAGLRFHHVVTALRTGQPDRLCSPAVLEPLRNPRFTLIEVAVDRVEDDRKGSLIPVRRMYLHLDTSERRILSCTGSALPALSTPRPSCA